MEYEQLIKNLRICSRCDFGQKCNECTQETTDKFCCDKLLHDAADAIEKLQLYVSFYKDMAEKSLDLANGLIHKTSNRTYTGMQPNIYDPAPYWTNPSWKAPDVTCTTAESEGK